MLKGLRVRESVAAVVVALVAASAVLTGSLGGEALARVERSAQSNWRSVYDLVVLPPGVDVTQELNGRELLQANFMSSLPGGISLQQWRRVQRIPGVQVAAPIANIGYFSRSHTFYRLLHIERGVYTVERTVTWDSGIDRRVAFHSAGDPTPERVDDCVEDPPNIVVKGYGHQRIYDRLVTGYRTEYPAWQEHPEEWQCRGLDPGGVFTVFGVDPVEEARLVGTDDAVTSGEYLRPRQGLTPGPYNINRDDRTFSIKMFPMLVGEAEWVSSSMRLEFHKWDIGAYRPGRFVGMAETSACARGISSADLLIMVNETEGGLPKRCIDRGLQRRLAARPRPTVLDVQIPEPAARVLSVATFEDGRWTEGDGDQQPGRWWVGRASRQRYQPVSDVPEGDWPGALRAVPTGSYGPEPTYRRQLGVRRHPFLTYDVVGNYDPGRVAAQFSEQSRWLPEGTYQVPRAVARFDASGEPVQPARLRPTGNPLGYLLQPPQALTTLPAARALLGRRPISAIRIRLADVEAAGEASWQRIEDTVRRIRQETGLQALVMAGASPARVLVQLPGIGAADQPSGEEAWNLRRSVFGLTKLRPPDPARTVEGFGWVEEPWLWQGAAVTYLRAGAASHLWLLALVGSAALVYLAAAFTSLALSRISTVAIRRAVGWSRLRVFSREFARAAGLGLTGSVAGLLLGLAAARVGGLELSLPPVIAAVPVATLVCCAAALWPAWRISGIPLAAVLSGTEVTVSTGTGKRRGTKVQRVRTLAVVELWRLRTRGLLALASGSIAVGAILFLTAVQRQFAGSLQVTVLGQQMLVQTGGLQQAGTIVAVLLAVLMLAELLWQAVRDRRVEIGMLRAIGWGRRHVIRLMLWQGALLGMLAAVVGTVVTTAALAALFTGGQPQTLLLTALPWAAAAGAALGALAAGLPAWAAARIPPAESLRTT